MIGGESIGGRFYAVLYTELYEGEQTSVAMEVLKNFCVHANITWGRGLGIGGNKIETLLRKDSFWGRLHKSTSDFRTASLQEHALFIREKIQGTDVYIKPEEVSRKGYIRKINQKMKKSNRVKFFQQEKTAIFKGFERNMWYFGGCCIESAKSAISKCCKIN